MEDCFGIQDEYISNNQGELFNYLRGDFDSAEDKMQFTTT